MENDQIEELAVNIIENEILKYSDLKSNITKGDKGISWDGYITIFDGKGRGKDNFEYKIDVQVKGRMVKKIKKGNIKFSIERAHLINYQKQNNGTLLLVVDIVDNLTYQIYYANLLPVDLKQLIESNKSKAKKTKISILLKPINESSVSSLKNICRNFALNSKRQIDIISIVIAKEGEKPSTENRTSPYFVMSAEDILKFSNFNAEVVFDSINVIQNFENQSDYINAFMLELLKAYDKDNKRKDILDLAERINNLLIQNEISITNQLNKFQIIKRKRDFKQDERNILIDLRNNLEKDDSFNKKLKIEYLLFYIVSCLCITDIIILS